MCIVQESGCQVQSAQCHAISDRYSTLSPQATQPLGSSGKEWVSSTVREDESDMIESEEKKPGYMEAARLLLYGNDMVT